MNAKHSAILLSGLLLMMIGIAWAQTIDGARPTCPPLSDDDLQAMLIPSAWARADWNAKTSRWDIDCAQLDSIANMPASYPANAYNAVSNATFNATNSLPARRRSRGNSNYVNTNPYNSVYNSLSNSANIAVNAMNATTNVNARPRKKARP